MLESINFKEIPQTKVTKYKKQTSFKSGLSNDFERTPNKDTFNEENHTGRNIAIGIAVATGLALVAELIIGKGKHLKNWFGKGEKPSLPKPEPIVEPEISSELEILQLPKQLLLPKASKYTDKQGFVHDFVYDESGSAIVKEILQKGENKAEYTLVNGEFELTTLFAEGNTFSVKNGCIIEARNSNGKVFDMSNSLDVFKERVNNALKTFPNEAAEKDVIKIIHPQTKEALATYPTWEEYIGNIEGAKDGVKDMAEFLKEGKFIKGKAILNNGKNYTGYLIDFNSKNQVVVREYEDGILKAAVRNDMFGTDFKKYKDGKLSEYFDKYRGYRKIYHVNGVRIEEDPLTGDFEHTYKSGEKTIKEGLCKGARYANILGNKDRIVEKQISDNEIWRTYIGEDKKRIKDELYNIKTKEVKEFTPSENW